MLIKRACIIGTLVWLSFAGARAAQDTNHWAYRTLQKPAVPAVADRTWVRTSIDAFILKTLAANRLAPSPEADKRTLLRRAYFDLVGLPPKPEEVRAFVADNSPRAYENVIDTLLASPRYGERWARHWMDAVHFAETHGHDQDRIRTNAWPYRQYLIESLNQDKPYGRFISEQVAGDVLFPNDPSATVALGFLAAGPWDESSLRDIREDTLDRQIGRYLDRDDIVTTVMQTFTSSTVQCARCHDHKFDPISQQDYYSLQAVFAGVERANRIYDADPAVHRRRQELLRLKRRVERNDREWLLSADIQRQVSAWERERHNSPVRWSVVEPITYLASSGATLTRQADDSVLATGIRADRDTYSITAHSPLRRVTAVRLEVMSDATLPLQGPGRQDNGNFHLSEFQLLCFEPNQTTPREISISRATADFDQTGWTIRHAVDRNEKTAWGIHPQVGQAHRAVFELREALTVSEQAAFVFILKQLHGEGHLVGRARLSVTDAPRPHPGVLPAEIEKLLETSASERSQEEALALAGFVLRERIARELATLPRPSLVYAAAADFEPDGGLKPIGSPRPVHLLYRGEITKPRETAEPGALSCVESLQPRFRIADTLDEGARRAALARWLTATDNPLTWRSIVNRVWSHHFGRGLVETPNDFGRMGAAPSHPELLDWLAIWFRDEAHGSLKQLHRLIILSSTYRQSAIGGATKALAAEVDSENRLL